MVFTSYSTYRSRLTVNSPLPLVERLQTFPSTSAGCNPKPCPEQKAKKDWKWSRMPR
uniref:Uncharacterized protein n=1 Tax=Utricularia reniformis TaxID=192314 RepID=A0A1Y0B4X5_9LAMI|nr:hypothetical protein AEK19_MT2264 [Utricularia reniformis]ART32409.1 hypothetical protein AEK19_MT2264 [Utricularia reniformis]